MINKLYTIGRYAVVLIVVALGIPTLSYCATSHLPWSPDCLNFVDKAKPWLVRLCSNATQDSSKADYYRVSSSRLQAEQDAQRRRDQERAKLDRQRQLEIEALKSMQQLDAIDAENRKREQEEEQLLLRSLTPGTKRAPVQKIGPNK